MKPETIAAKALHADRAYRGVVPAIELATTYVRDADYRDAGPIYTRDDNRTPHHAELVIAALEGGTAALTFASGMAAATATIRALVRPGDRIVAPRICYYNLRDWLTRFCERWDVTLELVDLTDLRAARAALQHKTRLVWVETPANPTWDLTDITAIADLAHAHGAVVAVDSTCATPVHTRPIALGADLVVHSATKFLGGHSDALAGVVVTARDDANWAAIRAIRHDEGACLAPFEAYLLLRGLRTLHVRVERSSATAASLAERLTEIGVTVRYPGLPDHPQHAVAERQMQHGFGSLLSIETGGGAARALAVLRKLQIWTIATSIGGTESLIEHRHSIETPGTTTPPDLLRLSVGLEHEDDLFDDLQTALRDP